MRLEDFAIRARVRNSWEAMDLGILLYQRDLLGICRSGLLVWLPILLLAGLVLFAANLFWAWLFLFVARPWYGRVALFILSRSVFSATPKADEVARALRGFVFKNPISTLFRGRMFSLTRTVTDPVSSLEGLSGAPYKKRVADLQGSGIGSAASSLWLGVTLIGVCLFLSYVALCFMFLPNGFSEAWQVAFAEGGGFAPILTVPLLIGFWLVMGVVEPLWVASGFALYLNRRSQLEGWDVELVFRSLAQRVGPVTQSRALLALPLATIAGPRFGQDPAGTAEAGPVSTIEKVYEREELQTFTERLEFKDDFGGFGEIFPDLSQWFGVLVWIVAGAIVFFIVWKVVRWAMGREAAVPIRRETRKGPIEEVFGLDLRTDSLPEDVIGEARRHWAKGEAKAALSLLYRGSLVCLRDRHDLLLESGDTEGRCVRKVENLGVKERAQYFSRLTTLWQRLAYGARQVGEGEFSDLAGGYEHHFGGAR